MKDIFKAGDIKIHRYVVKKDDIAAFNGAAVHDVCSTFVLAREIEWSSRLFVLEMTEEDEEGIGTKLNIEHKAPAFVGEELIIEAKIESFVKNELICNYAAKVGERTVAEGVTGQKILKRKRIKDIFSTFAR